MGPCRVSLGAAAYALLIPGNALMALLVAGAGLAIFRRRAALVVLAIAATVTLGLAVTTLPVRAVAAFENRAVLVEPDTAPAGVIVLGGYATRQPAAERPRLNLNARADRLTAGAALAQRFGGVPLVITDGGLAAPSAALLAEIGADRAAIVVENAATSTRENAILTAELMQPTADMVFVLVTSAAHMPRALSTFKVAGWTVVPHPVDYEAAGRTNGFLRGPDLTEGLTLIELASRELAATLYYYQRGWIASLWPGPDTASDRA